MPRKAKPDKPIVAFVCPYCHREYGDSHYHGPRGHAPGGICYDCWVQAWEEVKHIMEAGGEWSQQTEMLFLLDGGYTQKEAAHFLGVHRNTIAKWLNTYRQRPETIPAPIRNLMDKRELTLKVRDRLAAMS